MRMRDKRAKEAQEKGQDKAAPDTPRSVTREELSTLQVVEANLRAAAAELKAAQIAAQAAQDVRNASWAQVNTRYGRPGHKVYVDLGGPTAGRLQVLPEGVQPKPPPEETPPGA